METSVQNGKRDADLTTPTRCIDKVEERGIVCGATQDRGWGLLVQLPLPGGGKLGIYEPRHARPKPMGPG